MRQIRVVASSDSCLCHLLLLACTVDVDVDVAAVGAVAVVPSVTASDEAAVCRRRSIRRRKSVRQSRLQRQCRHSMLVLPCCLPSSRSSDSHRLSSSRSVCLSSQRMVATLQAQTAANQRYQQSLAVMVSIILLFKKRD